MLLLFARNARAILFLTQVRHVPKHARRHTQLIVSGARDKYDVVARTPLSCSLAHTFH